MLKKIIAVSVSAWVFVCSYMPVATQSSDIELLPDDPKAIAGQSLIMTCGLKRRNMSHAVGLLVFEITPAGTARPHTLSVDHHSVTILNGTHVMLIKTRVRTRLDRAMVTCFVRGMEHSHSDSQIIKVGYLPSKPVIDYHRVINWDNFTFKWSISRVDHVYNAVYTAWYKRPSVDSDFTSCSRCDGLMQLCPRQSLNSSGYDGSCVVRNALDFVHPDGGILIKVNATSQIGQTESKLVRLDLFHEIQPAAVKNLEALVNGTNDPVVLFNSPKPEYSINCIIAVSCSHFYSKSWTIFTRESRISQTLHGLPCYTPCTVAVCCKLHYSRGDYGYWSDLVTKDFTSQEGGCE